MVTVRQCHGVVPFFVSRSHDVNLEIWDHTWDTGWWFRNPKANHCLGCIRNLVKNGINYQPQLVNTDFWPSTAAWFFTSEDDFSKGFSLLFRLEELSLTDPWIDSEVHGGSIVRHFWYPSRRWCNIEDIFAKMWLTPLYIYIIYVSFVWVIFSSEHGRQMAKGQVTLWKMDPGLGSLHKFGCC